MTDLYELLKNAVEKNASDIFIVAGFPVAYKINGHIAPVDDERLTPAASSSIVEQIYQTAGRQIDRYLSAGDDDFAFTVARLSRFRVSTYKQRGSLSAVIRIISFGIPDYRDMHIPEDVMAVANHTKGLVVVTGPAGGGKSTTLACIIDRINSTRNGHIITLEEPIEFLYKHKQSIISQREVELDTGSYVTALRACLRQSPDVILLGEMRDLETIRTAMTAAEMGHLIISTLHTVGAANTIDRIIDVFPSNQQQQIRIQLSMLLQSVVSQQLIPTVEGTLIPVFEIMHTTNAIRTMIREAKVHQIDSVISTSSSLGMISMDASLLKLYTQGIITEETALHYASSVDMMEKRLNAFR